MASLKYLLTSPSKKKPSDSCFRRKHIQGGKNKPFFFFLIAIRFRLDPKSSIVESEGEKQQQQQQQKTEEEKRAEWKKSLKI